MSNWTTLFESMRTRWRRAAPVSERPAPVVPMERPMPRMPAEYRSLYTYLERRYASVVVLTFEQVEALLGCALPARACTDPSWWTPVDAATSRYAEAWMGARRMATPNFLARTVTFERME